MHKEVCKNLEEQRAREREREGGREGEAETEAETTSISAAREAINASFLVPRVHIFDRKRLHFTWENKIM